MAAASVGIFLVVGMFPVVGIFPTTGMFPVVGIFPTAGMFPATGTRWGTLPQAPSEWTRRDRDEDSLLRTGSASASLPMDCASRICQGTGMFSSL